MELLIGILMGLLGAVALAFWFKRAGGAQSPPPGRRAETFVSIEELRSIGLLSVFKVITKEIVTARDHWLGDWGKKYFEWLSSSKKMAMIFEFDLDFQFDLRDPAFSIQPEAGNTYRLKMPRCTYALHIRDITFYDEQKARFLPWLLPDLINSFFGGGFNEEDRNRLKEEARAQAESLALNLVRRLRSEVQTSARQTMEMLAKSFGVTKAAIEFIDAEPQQGQVEFPEKSSAPK